MKAHCLVLTLAAVSFLRAADLLLWKADFTDRNVWLAPRDFSGTVTYSIGTDTLSVGGSATNRTDTAWQMETKLLPFSHAGKYALAFTFTSHGIVKPFAETAPNWDNCIIWYDKRGRFLARHPIELGFADIPPCEYRFVRLVPEGAAQFKLKLGWDSPNVGVGRSARFQNLRVEAVGGDAALGCLMPDVTGPRIMIVSETPTREADAPVMVSVSDESGVAADSISVVADGIVLTNFSRKAIKDGFELTIPCGEMPWADGLHWLTVKAKDSNGCQTEGKKCFFIGDRPTTPAVTLRDDGMTLIDGRPFFPIGIYAVCKRDFNAYDWDRAVSDLKAAGFNLLHSYNASRDPGFHAAVQKYGMKVWMHAYSPDRDIVGRFRHCPWIIAWYLGDDTARNTTVSELHDRDDNIRAVDPTRLTTHADVCTPGFRLYAPATDNFLPEIYPVRGTDQKRDRCCVAEVNRTMRACSEAQTLDVSRRRHGNWPIIQHFKGWGDWKRFPTPDELYGMSFAAIVQGAQGITLYTYGGHYNEKQNSFNLGVTSSEAVWAATTNCTRRIASLVSVLVERTPAQPPKPTVLSGPVVDGLEGPSITALYKVKDGTKYLFAVNSADAGVTASFSPSASGEVAVMWEGRSIKADEKGAFTDYFKPLAVHVYRWR